MYQPNHAVNRTHTNQIRSAIDLSNRRFGYIEDEEQGDGTFNLSPSPELLSLMNVVLEESNVDRVLEPYYKRLEIISPVAKRPTENHCKNGNPYTDAEDAILLAGGKPEGRSDASIYSRRCILTKIKREWRQKEYQKRKDERKLK